MEQVGNTVKKKVNLQECEKYGLEIDRLTIEKDYEGLERYLLQIEQFSVSHDAPEYAPLFYYLGTGYDVLADHCRKEGAGVMDATVMKYRKQSFFYMRKAIDLLKECEKCETLLLLIYTNYANSLDACGRVIEALRIYREAIEINPSFGMALGNYGRALQFYANTVNDPGHYKELHCYAYQAVKCALKIQDVNMHDDAISYFEKMIEVYETQFDKEILSEPIVHKRYKLGKSDERKYRTWCLENHLFLNPLNDLINMETAFAHDPLTITHYTEGVNERNGDAKRSVEPPKWFAMLNQLKEEYIYSRFLCFDGSVKLRELHYADKEVKLSLASYDYVNYSIRLEELKSAFKNLFSIFDQIAFFINEFWKLNFKEHDADAEHVFKCECYPKDNVALLALYWSYCEFWERFGDAKSASERKLKNLRNALEHKYVKVHEYAYQGPFKIEDDRFYHISEDELRSCAMRLLELSREWIMELVYAVGIEESKKDNGEEIIHLDIVDYDDEWKR